MDGRKILIAWLKENGYDGLYSPGECGCQLSDLAPCGSDDVLRCEPGYKSEATEETSFRRSDGYDFIIGPQRTAS